MNTKQFVATLSESVCHQIIADFEQFEVQGQIGDSILRDQTRILLEQLAADQADVVFWMRVLAQECFRRFYHQQFPG